MLTNHDIRPAHRAAVMASVDVVNSVTPKNLQRATPCDGWNLSHLLAHVTVQHHGFAAAARGDGANPAHWDIATVADAVATDPAGTYAAAAADVLEALAERDELAVCARNRGRRGRQRPRPRTSSPRPLARLDALEAAPRTSSRHRRGAPSVVRRR